MITKKKYRKNKKKYTKRLKSGGMLSKFTSTTKAIASCFNTKNIKAALHGTQRIGKTVFNRTTSALFATASLSFDVARLSFITNNINNIKKHIAKIKAILEKIKDPTNENYFCIKIELKKKQKTPKSKQETSKSRQEPSNAQTNLRTDLENSINMLLSSIKNIYADDTKDTLSRFKLLINIFLNIILNLYIVGITDQNIINLILGILYTVNGKDTTHNFLQIIYSDNDNGTNTRPIYVIKELIKNIETYNILRVEDIQIIFFILNKLIEHYKDILDVNVNITYTSNNEKINNYVNIYVLLYKIIQDIYLELKSLFEQLTSLNAILNIEFKNNSEYLLNILSNLQIINESDKNKYNDIIIFINSLIVLILKSYYPDRNLESFKIIEIIQHIYDKNFQDNKTVIHFIFDLLKDILFYIDANNKNILLLDSLKLNKFKEMLTNEKNIIYITSDKYDNIFDILILIFNDIITDIETQMKKVIKFDANGYITKISNLTNIKLPPHELKEFELTQQHIQTGGSKLTKVIKTFSTSLNNTIKKLVSTTMKICNNINYITLESVTDIKQIYNDKNVNTSNIFNLLLNTKTSQIAIFLSKLAVSEITITANNNIIQLIQTRKIINVNNESEYIHNILMQLNEMLKNIESVNTKQDLITQLENLLKTNNVQITVIYIENSILKRTLNTFIAKIINKKISSIIKEIQAQLSNNNISSYKEIIKTHIKYILCFINEFITINIDNEKYPELTKYLNSCDESYVGGGYTKRKHKNTILKTKRKHKNTILKTKRKHKNTILKNKKQYGGTPNKTTQQTQTVAVRKRNDILFYIYKYIPTLLQKSYYIEYLIFLNNYFNYLKEICHYNDVVYKLKHKLNFVEDLKILIDNILTNIIYKLCLEIYRPTDITQDNLKKKYDNIEIKININVNNNTYIYTLSINNYHLFDNNDIDIKCTNFTTTNDNSTNTPPNIDELIKIIKEILKIKNTDLYKTLFKHKPVNNEEEPVNNEEEPVNNEEEPVNNEEEYNLEAVKSYFYKYNFVVFSDYFHTGSYIFNNTIMEYKHK